MQPYLRLRFLVFLANFFIASFPLAACFHGRRLDIVFPVSNRRRNRSRSYGHTCIHRLLLLLTVDNVGIRLAIDADVEVGIGVWGCCVHEVLVSLLLALVLALVRNL
jgi:hypothetical protein